MFIIEEKEERDYRNQFCNRCGRSVKLGSGLFVNRIPDLNEINKRIEGKCKFPYGDFVCIECDENYEEE